MRDVLDTVARRVADGEALGLATVVRTFRSAPRLPGASMFVDARGEVTGQRLGGCVEGAVYDAATEVLAGEPPRLERYGVTDDDAFAVGLTCGGIIDVFVQRVDLHSFPEMAALAASVAAHEPVAVATVVDGPGRLGARRVVWPDSTAGGLGSERLDDAVTDDARGLLDLGSTGVRHYGPHGERRGEGLAVFVESFAPPPRLLVFGAIDYAAAMARLGRFLGYHVTVCDARSTFATPGRFPEAHDVVVEWPEDYLARTPIDARTVICVLTHDPKFDIPLLVRALRTPAAYVGAMGSRRTHDDRLARLREEGLSDDELARLHSPIGLDIGARTPEETAISIGAEIIAGHWGGSGHSLADTSGRIHHEIHHGSHHDAPLDLS